MRILVIEDNEAKASALKALIFEVDQRATFKHCGDIRSAFMELDATRYDLVVLDLMMPLTEDGVPRDTGKELFQIISRSRLNRAARIVALTEYEELYEGQEKDFARLGVLLVRFDAVSNEWRTTVRSLLRSVSVHPRCDFVIVCALDVERDALAETRARVSAQRIENGLDVRPIEIGDYIGNSILLPRAGLIDASIVTASAIERYRPRLVAMTGVCAGVHERVKMGQVLVCETCWEYQVGKFTPKGFKFEPYQSTLPEPVRQRLLALCRSDSIVDAIYGKAVPRSVVRCQPSLATIVSGSAVVADAETREFIQEQHRKIDAVEMELAGVFRAVGLVDDSVAVLGVKSVADFADHRKEDSIHGFAATASAYFVVEAIEALLRDGP